MHGFTVTFLMMRPHLICFQKKIRSLPCLWMEQKLSKGWDLETGALFCTFPCEGHVDCAAVAPDGRTFVAGDAGGRVYFLRLEKG